MSKNCNFHSWHCMLTSPRNVEFVEKCVKSITDKPPHKPLDISRRLRGRNTWRSRKNVCVGGSAGGHLTKFYTGVRGRSAQRRSNTFTYPLTENAPLSYTFHLKPFQKSVQNAASLLTLYMYRTLNMNKSLNQVVVLAFSQFALIRCLC